LIYRSKSGEYEIDFLACLCRCWINM